MKICCILFRSHCTTMYYLRASQRNIENAFFSIAQTVPVIFPTTKTTSPPPPSTAASTKFWRSMVPTEQSPTILNALHWVMAQRAAHTRRFLLMDPMLTVLNDQEGTSMGSTRREENFVGPRNVTQVWKNCSIFVRTSKHST